ncbi:hypothetical protein IHE44_0014610 [Lamprotornis superbus]|uniref:Uncharacterized protein n=1 Tax=Lamprotornis superbus TaxID=245042 RepID=A0A835NZ75_9PASS|nr:hypothetical protein IHE44_0014610 [Lamprotornis superbus]
MLGYGDHQGQRETKVYMDPRVRWGAKDLLVLLAQVVFQEQEEKKERLGFQVPKDRKVTWARRETLGPRDLWVLRECKGPQERQVSKVQLDYVDLLEVLALMADLDLQGKWEQRETGASQLALVILYESWEETGGAEWKSSTKGSGEQYVTTAGPRERPP